MGESAIDKAATAIQRRLEQAGLPAAHAAAHAQTAAAGLKFSADGKAQLIVEGDAALEFVASRALAGLRDGGSIDAVLLANRERSRAPNALTAGR
jgi:hypothetical protein